jgi:hypothetical protein
VLTIEVLSIVTFQVISNFDNEFAWVIKQIIDFTTRDSREMRNDEKSWKKWVEDEINRIKQRSKMLLSN